MIVDALNRRLPQRYVAEPQVHLGPAIEIDVATYGEGEAPSPAAGRGEDGGGAAHDVRFSGAGHGVSG